MNNDLLITCAGLVIRFTGEVPPLLPKDRMNSFLISGVPADVTVAVSRAAELKEPDGALICDASFQRVYISGTRQTVFFRHTSVLPWDTEYACLSFDMLRPDFFSLEIREDTPKEGEQLLLSYLSLERLLHMHDRTVLHASWVMRRGKALLFSGPSGIGKSTQADLWKTLRRATIINGDKVGLAFPDGRPTAVGLPISGSSVYCENRIAPVRAVVMLRQAAENSITRMAVKDAFRLLAEQMPVQAWSKDDVSAVVDYALRLATTAPVYLLRCTKDVRAVDLLDRTLSEEE